MAEAELWAGDMGREWSRRAEALDRQLAPAGEAGMRVLAPQPGERILDLGCGSGATTETLSKAVAPGGQITGADISADQIAVARARPGNAGADFIVGDAQTHPFEDAAFDALFSRFGCMFFGDPVAAFSNLRRALKPGARAVLLAWRALAMNPWAAVPAGVGAEILGPVDPPPPGTPGPFAWAEPEIFAPIFEGAGFQGTIWSEAPITLQIGDGEDPDPVARALNMLMRIGPLARRLKEQPQDIRDRVREALAPRLAPFVSEDWVRMPGVIWIIESRA
ncbi:MAG: class I SAM-dependent methyltransferase [Paracoccaceae bacterium]|nr:class I SAM-dependent methyltransferase [Paracoccaceae bacterium]